jgi:hypothetical protein
MSRVNSKVHKVSTHLTIFLSVLCGRILAVFFIPVYRNNI